jgi:secreted trypsin-like serine protease
VKKGFTVKTRSLLTVLFVALATAVSSLVLPTATAATSDEGPITSIIGGRPASEPYPFMAYVEDWCGGSLIKANWVITAKHCASPVPWVRVGNNDRTKGQKVNVIEEVRHPFADVKLLKLAESVSFTPIPIADPTAAVVGTTTRLLGWGQTCPIGACGDLSIYNNEFDTSIIEDNRCYRINPHEICTNNPNQGGDCYGDSGGPQITKVNGVWNLIGSDSRGTTSACGAGPSIYVDLTSPDVRPWISTKVGGL